MCRSECEHAELSVSDMGDLSRTHPASHTITWAQHRQTLLL